MMSFSCWQQGLQPELHSRPVPKGPGAFAKTGRPVKHALSHGKQPGAKHTPAVNSAQEQTTLSPSVLKRSWGSRSDMRLHATPAQLGGGLVAPRYDWRACAVRRWPWAISPPAPATAGAAPNTHTNTRYITVSKARDVRAFIACESKSNDVSRAQSLARYVPDTLH